MWVGASTLSQAAPGNRGFSSQAAPGSQLPDCCHLWLKLQALKPNYVLAFLYPRWSMRVTTVSKDLDRRAGSKRAHQGTPYAQPCAQGIAFPGFRSCRRLRNELKKEGSYAQPNAWDTVFPGFRPWRRLRKGHITKSMSDIRN